MIPTILFIVTGTPIFHLEILYYLNILLDSIVIIGLKSRGFAIPLVGNKKHIDNAINEIKKVAKWKKIHILFDTKENQYNIGTGIADLKNKAPKTFKYLQEELKKLENNQ